MLTPSVPTAVRDGDQTPLAAARSCYWQAERLFFVQLLILVVTAVGVTALALNVKEFAAYTPLIAVLATAVDVAFERWVDDQKRRTARINELYDCSVFNLPWSTLVAEEKPLESEIANRAREYKTRDPHLDKLRGWFPAGVEKLPLLPGVIACQRVASVWNRSLQKSGGRLVSGLLVLYGLTIVVFTFNQSVQELVTTVIAPTLPLALMLYRLYWEHNETIDDYERIERYCEQLWQEALAGRADGELQHECRRIQDELFELRCRRPVVFGWFYSLFRKNIERRSAEFIAHLVAVWSAKHP